ncbi:MAG TPA: hypothetical protein VMU87_18845 [Stellaceae bacterium]|nr:hypothetical protein [Stellaceae bacterium]
MKALIAAFALLSFVAASTVPFVTEAQAAPPKHHVVKKHHVVHKRMAKKKHVASHRKTSAHKKKMGPGSKG